MKSVLLVLALAASASSLSKKNHGRSPRLHFEATNVQTTATATTLSSAHLVVTATVTQLIPTLILQPTNLETLGSPSDIMTVTITPAQAVTTITALPISPVIDENAAVISTHEDYSLKRQDEGWKVAVVVVVTIGVVIMLILFIVATRNQQRPGRDGNSSGQEENCRATFCLGSHRSDKNIRDSGRRPPTPFQRRGRPDQVANNRKGWELKSLWSARSSNNPSAHAIPDLPPLGVQQRICAATALSDTDTISPLNPKEHRGIQASTTASTDVTRYSDPVPTATQSTIVAHLENENGFIFHGASPVAKPAAATAPAHNNYKKFVFRGVKTTANQAEEAQINDTSLVADESLYNEQGFYVSPRNPRTHSAPLQQSSNQVRASPEDFKRPGTATPTGGFVFSNHKSEQPLPLLPPPRSAKRSRFSSEQSRMDAQGNTELPQPRGTKRPCTQQSGNKTSSDGDRASRVSAGLSNLSQPSRAPTPCPSCPVPDRTGPDGLAADDHNYVALPLASRPVTATGLGAAHTEILGPARHRMTLD